MARHVLWETESFKSAFRTLAPTRFGVSFLVSSGVSGSLYCLDFFYFIIHGENGDAVACFHLLLFITYFSEDNIFSRPGLKHILYYFLYFIPFKHTHFSQFAFKNYFDTNRLLCRDLESYFVIMFVFR
jgi:hypothetical protein